MKNKVEKFESVDCAICSSSNLETITNKGQFGFTTNVCICKNCGLSFLNPRWDANTYLNFYRYQYDNYYRKTTKVLPPEENAGSYYPIWMRLNSNNRKKTLINNILDVGSGDGSQLSYFQKKIKQASYFAIEPSSDHKNILQKRGITFVSDDVNSDWHREYINTFDFIIMRHVLEHFLDPVDALIKLKSVLSNDGIIYIAVPNALKFNPPLLKNFFRVVHTYYFNKYSLKNILHKAGFEVISIEEGDSYHDKELFLFAKKSKNAPEIEINKEFYLMQKSKFIDRIKIEEGLVNQLKESLKKIKRQIFASNN